MMLSDLEVDGDGDENVREDLQSLPELADLEQRIDCHGVAIAQESANGEKVERVEKVEKIE